MSDENSEKEPTELPLPKDFGFLLPCARIDHEPDNRSLEEVEEWLDRAGVSEDVRDEWIKAHTDELNWSCAERERVRMMEATKGNPASSSIEFVEKMETTLLNCRRRYRFLDCGDGKKNGFRYRMADGPVIWEHSNDPEGFQSLKEWDCFSGESARKGHDIFTCGKKEGRCFLVDASDIGSVAAEFVVRYLDNDFEFFEEIARLLAIRGGKRGGKRGMPMSVRLIEAAQDWRWKHGTNPTSKELKVEAKRLGIEVSESGWNKTLDKCGLGFLKAERGAPKKDK